jgi:hypothetical protein
MSAIPRVLECANPLALWEVVGISKAEPQDRTASPGRKRTGKCSEPTHVGCYGSRSRPESIWDCEGLVARSANNSETPYVVCYMFGCYIPISAPR